jgi:hypothetical protein
MMKPACGSTHLVLMYSLKLQQKMKFLVHSTVQCTSDKKTGRVVLRAYSALVRPLGCLSALSMAKAIC